MNATETANAQQRAASNPLVSAFVAASAGSGKTKLLTDRLLRLMLSGIRPDKILCLTYTKAAAAEMRIRLNRRLGDWVAMPEARLRAALAGLDVAVNAPSLATARRLFADVLDLPGGMRIETIHAFCQSLLRRFPLEARLSPHFNVADDEAFAQRLREAREAVLADPAAREPVRVLAGEIDELRFAGLSADFAQAAGPELLEAPAASLPFRLRAALGEVEDEAGLLAELAGLSRELELREALYAIAAEGNPSGQKWAFKALDWLALEGQGRAAAWALWVEVHLTSTGTPRTLKGFFGRALKAREEALKQEIFAESQRILALQERLKLARLYKLNAALLSLLHPVALAERGAKTLAAELSYNDLIARTGQLLIDPGADWVLFKLDGGLQHLLLDEVQDTAPAQWEIANALAAEFFAGAGAQEAPRSIFAVGDPKQSIFSFQGADLRAFGHYRGKFRRAALAAGQPWLDGELSVSFRSTAPVLELTDAVFAEGFARAGVVEGEERLAHVVSRAGQAGRVALWPLTQPRAAADLPDWDLPAEYETAESAGSILARQLADHVAARLRLPLPAKGRLARPGDFLILVRARGGLVGAITSALKARGIPVAGLDRMVLTAQPAVADMLALCDALLLPEDDLAFAQFLVSPLGGLSDASLMELALGRRYALQATLFERAAERADWQAAREFYEALRSRADYDTPFALLSEALGRLGGRARLLRRFGPEAAEPLDEFLAEALQLAQSGPASLQLFVQALRLSGASIKREAEAGGDEVRIMTVHGAKGLQAPIVIMPDTVGLPKNEQSLLWLDVPQGGGVLPVFCPREALRAPAVAAAQAARAATQAEEHNRLLYVALTRAEDELLVCGAAPARAVPETCWYEAVRAGFLRLGAREEDGILVHDCAQSAAPDGSAALRAATTATLPGWAGAAPDWRAAPAPKEAAGPERIVPSRAVEEKERSLLPMSPLNPPDAPAARRAAALARGTAIHALLQHLPGLAAESRPQAAQAWLATQPDLAAEGGKICAAVLSILHDPGLAQLFGPGSAAEMPLAGIVGGREIGGIADRVFIGADEILIADYKTDRNPPSEATGIPEKYLVQLAAYRAVLGQIFPGREVSCVLIWTALPAAMRVPPALLAKTPLA